MSGIGLILIGVFRISSAMEYGSQSYHKNLHLTMKDNHDKNNFSCHHELHLFDSNENDFHNYIYACIHKRSDFSSSDQTQEIFFFKIEK